MVRSHLLRSGHLQGMTAATREATSEVSEFDVKDSKCRQPLNPCSHPHNFSSCNSIATPISCAPSALISIGEDEASTTAERTTAIAIVAIVSFGKLMFPVVLPLATSVSPTLTYLCSILCSLFLYYSAFSDECLCLQ